MECNKTHKLLFFNFSQNTSQHNTRYFFLISLDDENRNGSLNVDLLAFQPPDRAVITRKFHWIQSPWKISTSRMCLHRWWRYDRVETRTVTFVYIDTKYYGERYVVKSRVVYTLVCKLLNASMFKSLTLFLFWANKLA